MNLNSITSRGGIVNLLSDYILSKIPSNELSIINVVDCVNFIVIKGKTTSEEVLNIQEIIDEIKSEFKDIFKNEKSLSHVIDVIEYKSSMTKVEKITQTFYNTENCLYNYSQTENFQKNQSKSFNDNHISQEIQESLVVTSQFPFGYSVGMGRELFYLGKHIIYNIPSNYPFTQLTLTIDQEPEKLQVFDEFSKEYDTTLKSAILDCVNMDLNWVISEMKKVDWYSESTNPLSEFDFVKKKVKDFVII